MLCEKEVLLARQAQAQMAQQGHLAPAPRALLVGACAAGTAAVDVDTAAAQARLQISRRGLPTHST